MSFNEEIKLISDTLEIKPAQIIHLFELLIQENQTTSNLSYKLGIPRTHLGRLLKSLQEYLQPKSQVVMIDSSKSKYISDYIQLHYYQDENEYRKSVYDSFQKISTERPQPIRELDQFHATTDTVFRRAMYLHNKGDIFQRDIVFLGDDDLTSVAVALQGRSKSVTVIDIDERVLNLIDIISDRQQLNIKTVQGDFRTSLLSEFKNSFDTVFTDPPYTTDGIGLFISKCKEILRERYTSSAYVCYGNSSRAPERIASVQNEILQQGYIFEDVISNFNQYTGADSIGNGSDLYSLKLISRTKKDRQYKRIYTHE